MTFTEISTEITERLNITSAEGTARVGRMVNHLYRRLTASVGLVTTRRAEVSAMTTIGSRNVTFSNLERIDTVIYAEGDPGGDSRILIPVTYAEILNTSDVSGDNPTHYALKRTNQDSVEIRMNCVPAASFELVAEGIEDVTTLSGNDEPVFPESYHEILVEGVLEQEYRKSEKLQHAAAAKTTYEQFMGDLRLFIAKNAWQDIYQSKTVPTETRFGTGGGGSQDTSAFTRLAANETVTGVWTFDEILTLASGLVVGGDLTVSGAFAIEDLTVSGTLSAQGSGLSVFGRDTNSVGNMDSIIADTDHFVLRRSGTLIDFGSLDLTQTGTVGTSRLALANVASSAAASRLLGRGSAGGAGDWETITLGSGLSFSGTELSSTGGGAGSGLPFQVFTPQHNEPPTSNYATLDTRNNRPVLDFDATTNESAVFTSVLPDGYDNGNIEIRILWSATSAVANDVKWDASFERTIGGGLDLDGDSFDTAQTATGTANGTSGIPTETIITLTSAQIDSLVAGDQYRLKVERDAVDGTDTMAGDAELISVTLAEV